MLSPQQHLQGMKYPHLQNFLFSITELSADEVHSISKCHCLVNSPKIRITRCGTFSQETASIYTKGVPISNTYRFSGI